MWERRWAVTRSSQWRWSGRAKSRRRWSAAAQSPPPPVFPCHPLTTTTSTPGYVWLIPSLPLFHLLTSRPSLLRHVITDVLIHHAVHLRRFQGAERYKRAQAEVGGEGYAEALLEVENLRGSGQGVEGPKRSTRLQRRKGPRPLATGVQWIGELKAVAGGDGSEVELKAKEERRRKRGDVRELLNEKKRRLHLSGSEGGDVSVLTVEQQRFALQAQQLWEADLQNSSGGSHRRDKGEDDVKRRWQADTALSSRRAEEENEEERLERVMEGWMEQRQRTLRDRETQQRPLLSSSHHPPPPPPSLPTLSAESEATAPPPNEWTALHAQVQSLVGLEEGEVFDAFPSTDSVASQQATSSDKGEGMGRGAVSLMSGTVALIHLIARENHLTHIVHPKAQARLRGRRGTDKAPRVVKWTDEGEGTAEPRDSGGCAGAGGRGGGRTRPALAPLLWLLPSTDSITRPTQWTEEGRGGLALSSSGAHRRGGGV